MISLKPFKAIRPTRDKAYLVATRSYLSYTEEELDEKLNNNPYTFLHVINPKEGRKLAFGKEKYSLVKQTFKAFEAEGIFVQDPTPAYYMYRQVKEGNEYIGLIAAVAVADYLEGRIKKHEKTLTQRERLFADYLEETGFNAEPVLLTYQDDLRLNKIYAKHIAQRSEYEFTSTDRVLHQLWLIDAEEEKAVIEQVFAEQEALYIADGHHRSASSATLAERAKSKFGDAAQHFMAFLIGEEQMKVYEFNRLVKGLNGLTKAQFLEKLQEQFLVEQLHQELYKPEKLHEMGMYLQGSWYKLVARTGTFDPRHPVEHLDAQILSRNILKPILGILNLKTDTRVNFLPGNEGVSGLMKQVDKGDVDVAFALYPISVEQIKSVADAKKTMPPKSTYIEPKLRSGLIVYKLEDQ